MNIPSRYVGPSSLGLFDPNRDWHAEVGYAVQHVAADFCLGLLIGQSPSPKTPSDDGLVSIHRRFDEAASTVSRAALPVDAAMLGNRLQMSIALGCRRFVCNRR